MTCILLLRLPMRPYINEAKSLHNTTLNHYTTTLN